MDTSTSGNGLTSNRWKKSFLILERFPDINCYLATEQGAIFRGRVILNSLSSFIKATRPSVNIRGFKDISFFEKNGRCNYNFDYNCDLHHYGICGLFCNQKTEK